MIDELRKTSLTFMSIISGWFVDYYGTPLLQSHAHRYPMFVDIENKRAAIPGSGNEAIAFTRLIDIARYVVHALDLTDWPQKGYIIGDSVTWHEFIQLAEQARGTFLSLQQSYAYRKQQAPNSKSRMTRWRLWKLDKLRSFLATRPSTNKSGRKQRMR